MLLFWLFRLTWCPINRRRHLSRFYGYTNWLPPAFTVCVISWLVYSIAGPIKRGPLLIFIRFFFLPCFFLFYLLCVVHCAIEGGGPSRNPGRWNHFWKRNTENHPEMFQEEKRATRNLPWRYCTLKLFSTLSIIQQCGSWDCFWLFWVRYYYFRRLKYFDQKISFSRGNFFCQPQFLFCFLIKLDYSINAQLITQFSLNFFSPASHTIFLPSRSVSTHTQHDDLNVITHNNPQPLRESYYSYYAPPKIFSPFFIFTLSS